MHSTYNKLGWGKGGKQNNPLWRDQLRSHNQKGSPFWPITGKLWSFIDCYCSSPMNVKRQSQIQPLQVPSMSIPSPKWEVSGRRDAFLLFFCLRWASQHKQQQRPFRQLKLHSRHPVPKGGQPIQVGAASLSEWECCWCSAAEMQMFSSRWNQVSLLHE